MPLSPEQSHRIGYVRPVIYMVAGLVLAPLPLFVGGDWRVESPVLASLLGLALFAFGAFRFWLHHKRDPAAEALDTIDNLPTPRS
jgi:hypothetical protein